MAPRGMPLWDCLGQASDGCRFAPNTSWSRVGCLIIIVLLFGLRSKCLYGTLRTLRRVNLLKNVLVSSYHDHVPARGQPDY